ncbi:MAG: DUF5606 domain-containing protein [Bacteroidota bacterium]
MDYKKILSISGKSGLYKLIATSKGGGVVESIIDGKRIPTFTTDRISSIEDISVYTTEESTPLKGIFKTIFEKEEGKKILDSKSPEKELKEYFTAIVPDWDTERVYVSDIRKIISWYNLLQEKDLLEFTEEEVEGEAATDENADKAKTAVSKEGQAGKAPRKTTNLSKQTPKAKSKQAVMKKTTTQNKAK